MNGKWPRAAGLVPLLALTALGWCGSATAEPASDEPSAADAARRLALCKTFREEFVAIRPGEATFPAAFRMGRDDGPESETPAREVTLTRPFAMARYETPQDLWQAVMGANPSRWQGPRNAVEMLSHADAVEFCRRTTGLLRAARLIDPDEVVRLPSEAEWEYCARAGSLGRYGFGDDPSPLGEYAWYHGNAAGNDPPVGAKRANRWGLFDMHGYLWEWCADDWQDNYQRAPADGRPWSSAADDPGGESRADAASGAKRRRVLRGGSWKDGAEALTSTSRRPAAEDLRDDAVGFRCVLDRRP